MKQSVRADQIKKALAGRHTEDLFLTEVKTGKTWDNRELLKFDAFAMKRSWANPCLTGYEIKVSRSDFQRDNKWPGYMAYCNKFSFVCPKGLIQKEELPDEVGLIWYYPDSGALMSKRPAKHRIVDIPPELYMYLLMSRIEPSKHPFFSDTREYCEAYLSDKAERQKLGKLIGTKLAEENKRLQNDLDDLKREKEQLDKEMQLFRRLKKAVEGCGINVYHWNDWEKDLQQRMSGGMSPNMVKIIERLARDAQELQRTVAVPEMEAR